MKKTAICFCLAVLTAAALFSGCAGQKKEVLTVYNWGDYIDMDVIDLFEKEFDCKVNYEMFEQNEDMYAKLKSAGSSYDVVVPSDYMIERMIREDMLEPIDKKNIPNMEYLLDYCLNRSFDPGNQYSVPYQWGTIGILYNSKMVSSEIDSWTALWDTRYEKNIFMMNSVRDSMMIALRILGYDMNTRDTAQIQQAADLLTTQKPLVLAYYMDEMKDKMIAGEAALCVMYSGDAVTCMDPESGNPDLRYVVPSEGSNLWFDNMCVVKGSKHKELAEKFINFMCREDIAARNRDYINYFTPQAQVYNTLDEDTLKLYPDEEMLSRLDVYRDLSDMAQVYDELWTKIIVD